MKLKATAVMARLGATMLCLALIAAAFLRGNHLLGFSVGVFYALVAGVFCWFCGQSYTREGRPSLIGMVGIAFIPLVIGFVMAFPAAVNPDVQHFIDDQATDRNARAELKRVFSSDSAFRRLSISTIHLKVVNVTIYGALPSRRDLDRLRERVINECPTLNLCPLHWDVTLRDTNEEIDGLDCELFPPVQEAEHSLP
jgi:hypothetical protein